MVRHVDLSTSDTLRVVATLAGVWRNPAPAADGLTHTSVTVRGDAFEIAVNGFVPQGTILPEVHGTVRATGARTATLTARVGAPPDASAWIWLAYGAAAAYVLWRGSLGVAALVGGTGALTYFRLWSTDRTISYAETPLAKILADQLDAVLAPHLSAPLATPSAPVA